MRFAIATLKSEYLGTTDMILIPKPNSETGTVRIRDRLPIAEKMRSTIVR